MFRKIVAGIGIVGALFAAEGLNRFGAFVSAFKGADAPFYNLFLIVSVAAAAILFAFVLGKANAWTKWIAVGAVSGSVATMLAAPALPVVFQIEIGLLAALFGLLAITSARPTTPSATPTA